MKLWTKVSVYTFLGTETRESWVNLDRCAFMRCDISEDNSKNKLKYRELVLADNKVHLALTLESADLVDRILRGEVPISE